MGLIMYSIKKTGLIVSAVVMLLAMVGCGSEKEEVTLTADQKEAMEKRLAPEGEVVLEKDVASAAPVASAGPRSGKDIFTSKCAGCHNTGAAGAPKVGVAADWAPRISKGIDTLYANAINGVGGMPAKGLCMDCSEEEIHATVDYMVEQSK